MIENRLGTTLANRRITDLQVFIDEKLCKSPDRVNYIFQLNETVNYINNAIGEGNWGVIGGLAKDALIGNDNFTVRDDRGNLRDVDIVINADNKHLFEQIRYQNPTEISIGGFMNRIVDIQRYQTILRLGSVVETVPSEVFTPIDLSLGNVTFPSYPPETLFHIYAIRGTMRPKDFRAALSLGRYIRDNPGMQIDENLYEGFHNFSKRIGRSKDICVLLHKAVQLYGRANLDRIIKLNDPLIRNIVLNIWDLIDNR